MGLSARVLALGTGRICIRPVAMAQTLQTSGCRSYKYGAEASDLFADSSKPNRKGQIEREIIVVLRVERRALSGKWMEILVTKRPNWVGDSKVLSSAAKYELMKSDE